MKGTERRRECERDTGVSQGETLLTKTKRLMPLMMLQMKSRWMISEAKLSAEVVKGPRWYELMFFS